MFLVLFTPAFSNQRIWGRTHPCSVGDPDLEGSENFCRIRSGTGINVSDPDLNLEPSVLDWLFKTMWEWNKLHNTPISWDYTECFVLNFSVVLSRILLPEPVRNLQTIWQVLAIQTFTPWKRLVLYFLQAKIKRKLPIVCKSQEEHIPKKFSIIYPLNKEGNPCKPTPWAANFTRWNQKPLLWMKRKGKKGKVGDPYPLTNSASI